MVTYDLKRLEAVPTAAELVTRAHAHAAQDATVVHPKNYASEVST